MHLQDHYDYSLRSFVIPIARAAGALKRLDPDGSEEVIMYRTMLDLIKPKLVYLDLPLFMALLSDLFPGVELPSAEGGELKAALEADLKANGLQVVPDYMTKIIQVCTTHMLLYVVMFQDFRYLQKTPSLTLQPDFLHATF